MVDKAIEASLHRLSSLLESDLDSLVKEAQTTSEMGNLTTCFDDVADSELEVVTPLLFDSKIGLLNFLDTRPPSRGGQVPQKLIPGPVRKEGFKLLTTAVKRMARQNLLDDKEMVKELKEVCLHTLQCETKTDVREECCEPLLLVLEHDTMEDETAGSKLVESQLYAFFTARKSGADAAKGVKRQRLRILGLMCDKHHAKMSAWEFKAQGQLEALLSVLEGEMATCRSDSSLNQVHAGCFEALDGFLQHGHALAAARKDFLPSVYADITKIVGQAGEYTRYMLPVAALKTVAHHARHLQPHINDPRSNPTRMCGALLDCCLHTNADLKRAAADALDAWLGAVRHSLGERPEVLRAIQRLFHNLTAKGVDVRHYCLAVRGYGALAAPIARIHGMERLGEVWFELAGYLDKVMAEFGGSAGAEAESEVEALLPDMLIALADILAELPAAPPEALPILAKLLLALFDSYPNTLSARRFLTHRAWYYVLHVLRGKGAALPHLLDLTVHPALLLTLRPALDPRFAPPGVTPGPGQKRQPCWKLSELWRSLHTDKRHAQWIRRRRQGEGEGEAGAEAAQQQQEALAELVHRRLWRAAVALVDTFDLHLLASHELDPDPSPDQPAPAQPEEEEEEGDGDGGGGQGGARPQASGMTGRERPRSPEDFGALLNLVDLARLLLRRLPPPLFKAAFPDFCRAMVRGATRHPLVSAFFKLLALAMHLVEQGGWFEGFSVQQVDAAGVDGGAVSRQGAMEVDGEAGAGEAWGCFCVVVKFAREAMAQSEQCFDDLLAALLQFVLALPAPMTDLHLQIPALNKALHMGTTVPFVAGVALDWLEKRVRAGSGLGRQLGGVLGRLELYLVRHEGEGEGEGEGGGRKALASQQRKAARAKYQLNKGAGARRKADKGEGEGEGEERADAGEMGLRAVRLLGQLGAHASLLAQHASAEQLAVSPRGSLLAFELDLGPGAADLPLPLDPFLLRVMRLAETSPDRKAKVGACELLHGMVMVAVGKHAQACSSRARADEVGHTRNAFSTLFRALLPSVFRLAVDTEAVAVQLFQPLSQQLVRWFASRSAKQMFELEAEAVVEAVLEGLESASNGKLREASSEALALYVEWMLRGLTEARLEEAATLVKPLLRRLYALLSHPSPSKRLGALAAVKELGKGLWRHARIVDQFLLELLYECVRSLRFAASDHPNLQSERHAVLALDSLVQLLFKKDASRPEQRYFDKLCQPRQPSAGHPVHPRRQFQVLPELVEWLLEMVGSHARPARRYAMRLIPILVVHLPGVSKPADWFQAQPLARIVAVVERDLASDMPDPRAPQPPAPSLRALALRAQHLLTALDTYERLLSGAFLRLDVAFKPPSVLPAAVALFAKHARHLPSEAQETATPSELRRHAQSKSAVLYALFKLLATLLERFPDHEPPADMLSDHVLSSLLLALLAPAELHLDVVTDPLVASDIPDQISKLCPLLTRRPHLLKRLQDKLAALEEEWPHLQMRDLRALEARLPDDHRLLFFNASVRMCWLGLRAGQDDAQAKRLLEHLLDAWHDRRSPAQLAVDDAMLALSLQLHGKPMQVWSVVMAPLQKEGERWQDHRCWSFYLAFRGRFDAFLAASDDILAVLLKLAGKKGREYCTVLVRNMLEAQRTPRLPPGQPHPESALVTRLLRTQAWLEGLCMPQQPADSFGARLKHGRDILHRLLLLAPWPYLTPAARDSLCQCACWLLEPGAGVEVHVEAVGLLPLLFNQSCGEAAGGAAVPEAVQRVTAAASERLDRYFPLKSSDLAEGSDEKRNFVLVLQALTRAVGECRTAAVIPLLRDHLLREDDHAFASLIADGLDDFVLKMTDGEASGVVDHILRELVEPTRPSDPTSLRVQRRVVASIACRVLRRLPPPALLALLRTHLGTLLAILSQPAPPGSPGESNKVSVLLVLETVYAVLDYGKEKEGLHGIVSKEQLGGRTLTVHLMDFLDKKLRTLDALSPASAEPAQAELSLAFHRAVNNALVTLVHRTQTKLGFYTRYVFTNTAWSKIVDTDTEIPLPIHANFKSSVDELAVFRSKYMLSSPAAASASARAGPAATPDAEMGSLSQSLSSLPSLFGYRPSSGPSRASLVRQGGGGSEEGAGVVLDEDALSRNACMRPLLAALHTLSRLPPVPSAAPAAPPEWMPPLIEKLSSPDTPWNVRLFITKLLINHRKSAQANDSADVFRPHAAHFFEAFFHKDHGVAMRLSQPNKEERLKGLEKAFNYMVREVCLLWMTWMRPQDATAFVLKAGHAALAWGFVLRLMEIVINSQPAVFKTNVQVLEVFLEQWRPHASLHHLEESVKRVTSFLKFRRKKGADSEEEKKEEELARKNGLQLMSFLLKTEVEMLSEEKGVRGAHFEHLPFNLLQELLTTALPLLLPPTDSNRVNRQYASNRLLLPATEACGMVLACAEAEGQLAGCKAKREELVEAVVERVERLEREAKVDQLLLVLERLSFCSDTLARRLHPKLWPHISRVNGAFLNACQHVLIATVKHLQRPPAPDDMDTDGAEEAKEELVLNVMPVLQSMLERQDARTQLIALCLLTGHAQDGSPPAPGHTGLLGMLSEAQVDKVVRWGMGAVGEHREEQVRFHWGALLQATALRHPALAARLALEHHMVLGLRDASQRVREAAFGWWHASALPKGPAERMAALLERLRMPEGKGTEEHWLGSSAWLMLQLAREQQEREDRFVFEHPLEDNAAFQPLTINTDFASASLPMTPMFAASSLPLQSAPFGSSQSQSQSQSLSTQGGGGGGDVLATLAEDGEGGSVSASLEGARYVEEQTQQQAGGFLYARSAPPAAPRPRNVKHALPPVVRRGAFATPLPPRAGGGAAGAGADGAVGLRMARWAEERRAREEQGRLARRRKVRLARAYRRGELPDVQIRRWELSRPLQDLLLRDSPLAKLLLTRLFRHLLARAPDALRARVATQVQGLLWSAAVTSADMVEALLELAVDARMHLPAAAVAAASQRSASYFAAIAALESQIRNPPPAPAPALSSPSPSGRGLKRRQSSAVSPAPGKGGGRRGQGGVTEDDWHELSKLYQKLGEEDIVRGLYDKFSRQPQTTEALQLELQGRFDEAYALYKALIDKDYRVQDGSDTWDADTAPQDLEVELWDTGQVQCLIRSQDWKGLSKVLRESMLQPEEGKAAPALDDALWTIDNRALLPTYLRSLIGTFSQSGDPNDRHAFVSIIEEGWYEGEEGLRRGVLVQSLLPETALGLLLSEKPNRQWAKELVRVGLERFLEEWGASSEVGAVARESKVRGLQRVVELEESLAALQHPASTPDLLAVWDKRLPRRQQAGDAGEWGLVLGCRLALLRRMLEGAEGAGGAPQALRAALQASVRHTYLALGGMARRQGSLSVARECQRLAESGAMAGEWQLRCLAARLKLHLAECQRQHTPAALDKMRRRMQSVDEEAAGEGAGVIAARVKLHALRAAVHAEALRSCGEGERAQLQAEAVKEFRSAIRLAEEGRVVGGAGAVSGRGEQKLHVRLALFCDAQLRALQAAEGEGEAKGKSKAKGKGSSAHKGKESGKEELAEVYMAEMLAGMCGGGGGGMAAEHLPRCLQLLAEGGARTLLAFQAAAPRVPPAVALRWMPQLLSHLARDLPGADAVAGLLARVARDHPQAVFFATRVVAKDMEAKGQGQRLERLRESWREQEAGLEGFCDGVRLLQHPEKQLQDLFADLLGGTADPHVLAHLLDDFSDARDPSAAKGQYRKIFAAGLRSKHRAMLEYLEKLRRDKVLPLSNGKGLSESQRAAIVKLSKEFNSASKPIKDGKMPLKHLAPKLAEFEGVSSDQRGLVVPGQQQQQLAGGGEPQSEEAQVQVASMDPMVLTLKSLALPKRLIMRGSDGKEYWWLAKAGEDLRQDERVQQVLHSMNQVLAADAACARRRLALKTYAVVPLSQQVGLLEWVQGTCPLEALVNPSEQDAEQARLSKEQAARYRKELFPTREAYQPKLEKASAADTMDKFRRIVALRPDNVFRTSLMANAATPQAELTMRSNFAASLATMSAAHYILGIGDRHLGNTLVLEEEGSLVGIDFGHAFGSATQLLPVPELMPFRLTAQMVGVLAPLDAEGLLKRSMAYVMEALRANRHVLKQTMGIFISDPTVDWKRNAANQARNQGIRTDTLEWSIDNKLKTLKMKLDGEHPGTVMLEELRASTHKWIREAAQEQGGIAQLVLGKKDGERRKLLQKEGPLSASEQVAALVSQATDPLILGHTWFGWSPYC